jgi:hypothetical protein
MWQKQGHSKKVSTRAKWRALRSARSSKLKKCLTTPALLETRCYDTIRPSEGLASRP